MNYVQATTGHGGWPMSVFLTPDLEPVFGGTYWPGPDSDVVKSGGHPGFSGILDRVQTLWQTQPERCLQSAKSVSAQLKQFSEEGKYGAARTGEDERDGPEIELLEEACEHYAKKYDSVYGGFGNAPKFPTPANLAFLLIIGQSQRTVKDVVGEEDCYAAQSMVLHTLRSMWRGGIHDQIGSAFARYSVTRDWSLPHFEKMLVSVLIHLTI